MWWWSEKPLPRETRIARRDRAGGYTMEARLPWAALGAQPGSSRDSWRLELNYQDVSGIYQTWWEGRVMRP